MKPPCSILWLTLLLDQAGAFQSNLPRSALLPTRPQALPTNHAKLPTVDDDTDFEHGLGTTPVHKIWMQDAVSFLGSHKLGSTLVSFDGLKTEATRSSPNLGEGAKPRASKPPLAVRAAGAGLRTTFRLGKWVLSQMFGGGGGSVVVVGGGGGRNGGGGGGGGGNGADRGGGGGDSNAGEGDITEKEAGTAPALSLALALGSASVPKRRSSAALAGASAGAGFACGAAAAAKASAWLRGRWAGEANATASSDAASVRAVLLEASLERDALRDEVQRLSDTVSNPRTMAPPMWIGLRAGTVRGSTAVAGSRKEVGSRKQAGGIR